MRAGDTIVVRAKLLEVMEGGLLRTFSLHQPEDVVEVTPGFVAGDKVKWGLDNAEVVHVIDDRAWVTVVDDEPPSHFVVELRQLHRVKG